MLYAVFAALLLSEMLCELVVSRFAVVLGQQPRGKLALAVGTNTHTRTHTHRRMHAHPRPTKAAEDSRTPKPVGDPNAPRHSARSWSGAVLCGFRFSQ